MDLAQILNLAGNGKTKAATTTAEPQANGAGFLVAFSTLGQETAPPQTVLPGATLRAQTVPNQPDAKDERDPAAAEDGADASATWTVGLFQPEPAAQQLLSPVLPPATPPAEPDFIAAPDTRQSKDIAKIGGQQTGAITKDGAPAPAPVSDIKTTSAESDAAVLSDAGADENRARSPQDKAAVVLGTSNLAAAAKDLALPITEAAPKSAPLGQVPTAPQIDTAAGHQPRPNPAAPLPPATDGSARLRPAEPSLDRAAKPEAPQIHTAHIAHTPQPEAEVRSGPTTRADNTAGSDVSALPDPPAKGPILPLVAATGFDPGLTAQPDIVAQIEPKPMPQHTGHAAIASAQNDLPHGLARQLAETITRFPDRPVDISLSPEELGRVRMTLTTTDNALTLSLVAERPETLDLMRRNIDQLAQDFRELGYENLSFSFAQGEDPRNAGTAPADARDDGPPERPDADQAQSGAAALQDRLPAIGIDIRI